MAVILATYPHVHERKNQVVENTTKKPVASVRHSGVLCHPMAKNKPKPEKIQIRPTDEDFAIIEAGKKKHGLDQTQIIRMALRRLAEADNLKVVG
jgi:hypothetical protein